MPCAASRIRLKNKKQTGPGLRNRKGYKTMLLQSQELLDYKINAVEGVIGLISDLYFDDEDWLIRYFVVDLSIAPGRKTLISPLSVNGVQRDKRLVDVALSKEQVTHSPDIDTKLPVHRQHEMGLIDYYQWETYWPVAHLNALEGNGRTDAEDRIEPHLRSLIEVGGYQIHTYDEKEIGHVEGAVIDSRTWAIQALIVDTSKYFAGKRVRIAEDLISSIDWAKREVFVNVLSDAIKEAPRFELSSIE